MRLAVGRVLAGIIIAEFYAQTQGIGVMIYKASNSFLQGGSDRMMFGILLFTLFGIILYEAVGYAERYFQRASSRTSMRRPGAPPRLPPGVRMEYRDRSSSGGPTS